MVSDAVPSGGAEEMRSLYAYDRWADRRILEAAAALGDEELNRDLDSSFPSVRATLAHILGSEWIWLSRWRGHSPTGLPDSWDLATLDALRERWEEVEEEQRAFVEELDDDDLPRIVSYRTTDGTPHHHPLGILLRHVVNHSSYHRGQITTMLRQLGAEPVSTDLIRYHREREGGEAG